MSERIVSEHDESTESVSAEWRLPASVAIRSALGTALDSYAPSSAYYHHTAKDGRGVEIYRKDRDGGEVTTRVAIEAEPFAAAEYGVPEKERVRVVYEYHPDETDPQLLRTDWAGRGEDDEPEEVSEGEAKQLLNQLAALQPKRKQAS